MSQGDKVCVVCRKVSDEVPLISFLFKGSDLFICPQHLPILIHDPSKLSRVLPGADALEAADHHD